MHKPLRLVWVSAEQRDLMSAEATRMSPFETGGVLMGYFGRDGTELVITDVIGPGPNAIHTLTSFAPDLSFQHREIAKRYFASNRLHTYVADWHTHPNGPLSLSRKDKQSLLKVARCREARLDLPTMLLLAGGVVGWDLGAFQLLPFHLSGFGRIRSVPTSTFSETPARHSARSVTPRLFGRLHA